jgi:hypothetical protein
MTIIEKIEKRISHLLYQHAAIPVSQQICDQVSSQIRYQVEAKLWEPLFEQLKVQVPNSFKESLKR